MSQRVPLLVLPALLALGACGDAPSGTVDAPSDVTPVQAAAPADPTVYTGTLAEDDETLESGEYLDSYEVVVREGQWLRVEVVSADIDPYLLILSPTGEQTDVDDSAAGNTSMTKAVVEAEESGEWTVVVTSYEVGETGDYEVTLEVLDTRPDDAHEGRQVTEEDVADDAIDT